MAAAGVKGRSMQRLIDAERIYDTKGVCMVLGSKQASGRGE
jgi:hypothetical protein